MESINSTPVTNSNETRSRPEVVDRRIKVEPVYLVFPPPHRGRCIQNVISIYNTATSPCVFKLSSQSPSRYVAKPHVAVMAPQSATRIQVTLRDMNNLGEPNISPDTRDRFRITIKFFDESSIAAEARGSAKEIWAILQSHHAPICHEQDLIAYFTKEKETPVGGLVTFFPPTYLPVTAHGQRGRGDLSAEATSSTAAEKAAQPSDATVVAAEKTAGDGGGIVSFARLRRILLMSRRVPLHQPWVLVALTVVVVAVVVLSMMRSSGPEAVVVEASSAFPVAASPAATSPSVVLPSAPEVLHEP